MGLTPRQTSRIVASFGAGLASATLSPSAEAAIIPITASPGAVNYVGGFGGATVHLNPASVTFFQWNDAFGKTMDGRGAGVGFTYVAVSQTITVSLVFDDYFQFGPGKTGTYYIGFKRSSDSLLGWLKVSFGGIGGPVTYLAGAYNDQPRGSIHVGTTAVPEPTSLALAALSALALGGRGVRRLREKRQAS